MFGQKKGLPVVLPDIFQSFDAAMVVTSAICVHASMPEVLMALRKRRHRRDHVARRLAGHQDGRVGMAGLRRRATRRWFWECRSRNDNTDHWGRCSGFLSRSEIGKEAPVGVGPTMADLQSAALATWLRRRFAVNACTTKGCKMQLSDGSKLSAAKRTTLFYYLAQIAVGRGTP